MDGARVQKKSGGKPGPAVWVPAAILAVLLAAYLGLCGWVSASDTILPNVTAAGLDLSGMTQAEAEQAINENLSVAQQAGSGWAVGLSCDGYIGTLDGSSFQVDAASLAQASLSVGRGSFFTGGAQYLRHLFGAAQDLGADQVQLTEAGRTELERQLQAADSALGSGGSEDGYTADLEAGTLTLVKGHTHRSVDRQGAEEAVKSAYAQLLAQGQADTVQLPILDSAPQEPDFQAIHGELYAEAANAAIDPDTCEVLPHTVGVDFDTAQAQRLFQQAQEGETVEVPLTVTQPDITQEILADRLFADLLGQGTSQVSGSSNRKFNVKLSAEACNGVILMPGEEFSYNNTTGSRSADKGYLPAPVYSGGASVDETGGGICQTSSTIYYAVLHTTLEIVERHAHMYSVGYVPDGMDATVYFGLSDFRFKNNTDYPVKIVTESYDKNGLRYLTVKLYGTNVDGRYAVPERTQFDFVSPTTQYRADESIPQGTTKVDAKQNAYTGRSARAWRVIYEKDGTLVEKQDLGVSTYKMRPTTILYNPADGDPSTWVDGVPPKPGAQPGTGAETGAGTSTGTQTGTESGGGTGGEPAAGTGTDSETSAGESGSSSSAPTEDIPAPDTGDGAADGPAQSSPEEDHYGYEIPAGKLPPGY
ncbi:VanW family protein [Clostridium sp. DFI.5.61]|uniref:VanW family protein n=1 Tax=unclassified Clostridium TaxID=2614128 RepID=UPI002109F5EC|nr:VanW family protein [Clostridium sp. DFI.5.61]MBS5504610.1 VanW family protein [Oscillospiraceae bacterium]MCB5925367.1 VanW family protein [bacterium 210820-DFI.5.26]MCQ5159337.1 VanW family protein [Clostridium sp. DFI.5.61]